MCSVNAFADDTINVSSSSSAGDGWTRSYSSSLSRYYYTITKDGTYTITGSTSGKSARYVVVSKGVKANITFDNLTINAANSSSDPTSLIEITPFTIEDSAQVTLTLQGSSALTSSRGTSYTNDNVRTICSDSPTVFSVGRAARLIIEGDGSLSLTSSPVSYFLGSTGDGISYYGHITINSGTVTAIASGEVTSSGGDAIRADTIIINGGKVTATGGNGNNANDSGTGSGGGKGGAGLRANCIIINGGEVTATSGVSPGRMNDGMPAIAGVWNYDTDPRSSSVIINGGTVVAIAGANIKEGNPMAIGVYEGKDTRYKYLFNFIVTGGNFSVNTLENLPMPTNGSESVYRVTLSLSGVSKATPVSAAFISQITGLSYGFTDVMTAAEGKLTLWLPAGTGAITVIPTSGSTCAYTNSAVTVTDNNLATATLTASTSCTYAKISITKDGETWSSCNRQITLRDNNGAIQGVAYDGTLRCFGGAGTYTLYDGETSTGKTATINSSTTNTTVATLNYYTVTFSAADSTGAKGSTIGATYGSTDIPSNEVVLAGKELRVAAVGKGAAQKVEYVYAWTGKGVSASTVGNSTLTISNLSQRIDVRCTVSVPPNQVKLSQTGTYSFGDSVYSYSAPALLTATVTSTGNRATGALTVALSSGVGSAFSLSVTSLPSLPYTGATNTFTVVPKTGLSVGAYTDTVKVFNNNVSSKSFVVSFTVTQKEISIAGGRIAPKTYDGTDSVTVDSVAFGGLAAGETMALGTDYTVDSARFVGNINAGDNRMIKMYVSLIDTSATAKNYRLHPNASPDTLKNQTILQRLIVVDTAFIAQKIYDGVDTASIDSVRFKGFLAAKNFTAEYYAVDSAFFNDAEAGDGKTVTAYVSLSDKAKNYVLENGVRTLTNQKKQNPNRGKAPVRVEV
jgi:hypothetical protein